MHIYDAKAVVSHKLSMFCSSRDGRGYVYINEHVR